MSLPHAVDQAVRKRFTDLTTEGEGLLVMMHAQNAAEHERSQFTFLGEYSVCVREFSSFRTRVLGLMSHLGVTRFDAEVQGAQAKPLAMAYVLGVLKGLADDYASGFLDSVIQRAEAEVAADYLGQADSLLKEGQSGKYDHVPAAVLLGAVLEQALRTLSGRQTPAIPTTRPNGEKIMLNALIDSLKKAGIYNELKAKQLRSWADIRNAAAHGDFGKFKRADVEAMQVGVATFLADFL